MLNWRHTLREKCPKAELFPVRIFLYSGLNTGKWGPEINQYLETFHAVMFFHFSDIKFEK